MKAREVTHNQLHEIKITNDYDYEPYGKQRRDGHDCSSGCRFFIRLDSKQHNGSWGVCTNYESHRAGLLTFEHQGCKQFKSSVEFRLSDFRFRKKFWTPFDQYREHIGVEFEPIEVFTGDDDGPGQEFPLFTIRLATGEEIDAWEEEVSIPSDVTVDGKHPPSDDEI